eukprot:12639713-Ditylum_brightwellii.AAC.1
MVKKLREENTTIKENIKEEEDMVSQKLVELESTHSNLNNSALQPTTTAINSSSNTILSS